MNRHAALLVFLPALAAVPARAAVEAPIRSVTVYPGTAMIQRELTVAPGMQQVEVGGLPTEFPLESLQVESGAGIRVGQVSFHDAATIESANPRAAALEARIQDLKDKESALDIEGGAAEQVKDFLSHLGGAGDGSKSAPPIDARSLAGIIDTLRKGMSDSLATVRRIELQKRSLDRQIEASQHDLDEIRGKGLALRTAVFPVSVERAGKIVLSYSMSNAGWVPKYRAALDSATGKVTLERQALIYQQTGEDWSEVQLKLSTGQPRSNASAPDPGSWYVNIVEPQAETMSAMAVAAPAPAAPRAMMMRKSAAPEPMAELQTAFATTFEAPSAVSVPADGTKVTVALASQVLAAKTTLRTAPRIEEAAYVEAEAERPEGVWLPGEVQLSRDGDYVGTLHWRPEAADKFLLSFGRDDRVRVKYLRTKTNNGTGSLLDSRKNREVTDTFTITSSHPTAYPLLVLEAAPVSASDEVKVEKDFSPKPDIEDWQGKAGVVAWQTTLQPNAKLNFEMHYKISYAKDKQVTGLP